MSMEVINIEHLVERLRSWQLSLAPTPLQFVVGVDVGATNVRIAFHCINSGQRFGLTKFQCSSSDTLMQELRAVADLVSSYGVSARAGSLAGAGRKLEDRLEVTNYVHGKQDIMFSQLPSILFPPQATVIMNDLEATCYGLRALHQHKRLGEFFEHMWGSCSECGSLRQGHTLVLAMGTGLGVALLAQFNSDYRVLPLEGGHSLASPVGPTSPARDADMHMCAYIAQKLYKGQYPIEFEDVCSGRGLEYVYEWVAHDKGDAIAKNLNAKEIVKNALGIEQDRYCSEALLIHYRYLMRAATNFAITTQCKSIVLAGDNIVENAPFVTAKLSQLQAEFVGAPKGEWLRDVCVMRQAVSYNLNIEGALLGAMHAAVGTR